MSFIKELRRRNVIRVGTVYAVAAWLLIQIAATVFPVLNLPDWTVTLLTVLILFGFPVALVLAWAFELTPEGIKLEKDVVRSDSVTHLTGRKLDFIVIAVMALALVYFTYDEFFVDQAREEALAIVSTQMGDVGKSNTPKMSIAVLPFVNMSDDPGNEYFSDGLSEEILNLLVKTPGLKVIARTSSFAFKGKNEDLRDIGQKLGVKTMLEGSVRKSGERVRITAQLIDVSDGAHIWSDTYNRTMTDIFTIQDDVAAAIIDALQIYVGAKPTRGRPTENTAAYALFLKARASLNLFEYRDAEEILLEAIELDPKFAEAHELLAYSYWNQAELFDDAADAQKLTGDAAAMALSINPDLVFAQALYESVKIESYSHLAEIEAFERAVREQPANPAALDAIIFDLLESGYLREALVVAERFVDLDPLSLTANYYLANALYAVGHTSEASAALEIALQLDSEFAHWMLGAVNLADRQDEVAVAHFEAYLQQYDYPDTAWVRELVTAARDPATGQAYLDRRIPEIIASMPEEEAYVWRQMLTKWYLLFGYLDRHFELILDLDLADSTWTGAHTSILESTIFRRLGFTAHRKYLEVAEMHGIVDVWEHRGPPDFCNQVGGDWSCE